MLSGHTDLHTPMNIGFIRFGQIHHFQKEEKQGRARDIKSYLKSTVLNQYAQYPPLICCSKVVSLSKGYNNDIAMVVSQSDYSAI